MSLSGLPAQARQYLTLGTRLFALLVNLGAPVTSAAQEIPKHSGTATPIKHVILIIGENRTFDHVFATLSAEAPGSRLERQQSYRSLSKPQPDCCQPAKLVGG